MNKLIILDLDGTLLNEYGKVSDYSKKCLAQYEKDNNLVVLTSQRSYSEMLKLHNELKLTSPLISSGGSELHFFKNEHENIILSLDKNTLKNLFIENNECIKSAFYHYNSNLYIHNRMDILLPLYGITSNTIVHDGDFKTLELEEPNMIFMVIYINKLDLFMKNFNKYNDYLELKEIGKDLNYALFYLNIKNVNKMYAVLELMTQLKYTTNDLIVVGDSEKDKEMLSLDGITCAMINGEKAAKEAAKYISKYDNAHDGAVKFINEVLNINI